MRRLALLALIGATGAVGLAALARPGAATSADGDTPSNPPPATASVDRRTLTLELELDGQLGYDGALSLVNWRSGVVTALPEPGTVIRRGEPLYELNGRPGPIALYGARPAWRDLGPGVTNGSDVRQLERNLQALGHFPADTKPDTRWDATTTEAVRAFQADRRLPIDGRLELGEIAFLPGPVRVGDVSLRLGEQAAPGAPALTATSTERVVTLDVSVDDAERLEEGDAVEVQLPDGTTLAGTVASISDAVTAPDAGETPGGDASEPTVAVAVALVESPPADVSVAPVTVRVATERREDVLAVPVSALVALVEGGYAVEVVADDGSRRLVGVDVGLFADGWVEVESDELSEGQRVVVPR